jgi:hypothetical protein
LPPVFSAGSSGNPAIIDLTEWSYRIKVKAALGVLFSNNFVYVKG